MKIEIKNLSKAYNNEIVFERFNLTLENSKVNCIVGKSGCGKSTLLNMLARILKFDDGEISGITKNEVSYIFQEDRLIEWLTVEENLIFALKKYYDKLELKEKIKSILSSLGLEDVKNKYPEELSGGMKQRVNIARAFGKPSKIILMDEPFKSLDYTLKYKIIDEFKNIMLNENRTVVLVTHDVDEAIYFNGNIIVFGERPVKIKGIFNDNLQDFKSDIINLIK
ncbi:ABC transporter ATP-binding protein [Clostridium botulinum]|uniref:Aliphatic sulfonates import ATP-binding protein SsuB n=1 Tax=Clostridium botulinum (strain Eklund 17B / Type B) TaxID=935198 RepID=B2TNC1_CLOBB|nr:aliphatic sulfonates import ATP-binding protein SsuB [Clostridium botulinum B str. Eklund 17B (NRP)]MBY6976054.1 ABC transporter ATP-binding protein [Clostridium botulinum]MBY7000476.1 ABC transporter ATP-binding protein [Clostridium botulinum]MCR1273238.1 ABC transporter ATP-binding protein [Clostridium botulinum]NFD70336.1 ABC transporter ATP-binding protein [Clostridium botulinum]